MAVAERQLGASQKETAMPDQTSLVHLALMIRRGQLALANIPEEHRQAVRLLAGRMSDAQCGQLAAAQERSSRHLGKHRIWQKYSS